MTDQPRADAIAALRAAIESLDDDADTNRIWRAMSADRLAEVVGLRYFCGAPAMGGACVLPSGHNMGNADVPANHCAALAPADPTADHQWTTDDRHDYEWCRVCLLVRQANGSTDAKPCKGPARVGLRAPSNPAADEPAWYPLFLPAPTTEDGA